MVPFSMANTLLTPDHDFTVAISIDIEYLRNDERCSHIYHRTSISVVYLCDLWCAVSNDDIFNDLDGPLTQFSRSWHFRSRIYQKRCVLRTRYGFV